MRIPNPVALAWCYRIALWGADARSRSLLFAVALLTCMDPHRRKPLRALLRQYVRAATDNAGLLSLTGRAGSRTFCFSIRGDNSSDYQSLTECLGDMYPAAEGIRYVLDGGANVGLFALAALRLPELTEVVMVEPSPANLDLLRRNTRDVPGCVLHAVALSDVAGAQAFDLAAPNTGRLVNAKDPGAVEVTTMRIVDIIPRHWDPAHAWIKLDIEGAEYEVVPDLLASGFLPAQLSLEVHDYLRRDGAALVREIERYGYDVAVDGHGHDGYVCRQVTARRREAAVSGRVRQMASATI